MANSAAIKHSRQRLQAVATALQDLRDAPDLGRAEMAWSIILNSGNGVFAKLEQGAKVNGSTSAWYGRVKSFRKSDPLLSYMHHARNSDEHSIEDVTVSMMVGQARLTIREPYDPTKLEGLQITIGTDKLNNVVLSSSDENIVSTKMYDKPTLELTSVKDRGQTYDAPQIHSGTQIENLGPVGVAELFFSYLEALLEEAQQIGI